MIRVLLAMYLLIAAPVYAQTAAVPAPAAKPAPAPAPAVAPALTPAQANQALDTLKDPAKRDALISVLEAVSKAAPVPPAAPAEAAAPVPAPAAAPAPAAEPVLAIPLAPDSLGAQILVDASQQISTLSGNVIATFHRVTDLPLTWSFLVLLVTDPWSQAMLLSTGWKLAVALGVGLAAQRITRLLLRRPQRALQALAAQAQARRAEARAEVEGIAEAEAGQTEKLSYRYAPLALLRRLPLALLRLLLDLLPIAALVAAGYAVLGAGLGAEPISRLVILGVLHAYALCRVATSLTRMVVGPGMPRLLPVAEDTALYVLHWMRRLTAVGFFGYTLAEVGLLFGLYRFAHDSLIKVVVLALHVMLVIIVLQKRGAIAEAIRAREGASGAIAMLRNRAARLWHYIAIFYLVALWVVWALDIPDGFSRLLRLVIWTGAILAVARVIGAATLGTIDRASKLPPDITKRYPNLGARIRTYHPVVRALVKTVIAGLAVVALLQAWGLGAAGWLVGDSLGHRLLGAIGTIGITIAFAVLVWEGANLAIQRHLSQLAREAQLARSARLRTLLPMVRTTLLVAILLVAGLMILSEIGVNIAPLLAGAGVVGLAIGFGSQRLVQDIITGLFLLLENTMQVGDSVTLGGLSGTVEALSVRTIRLRAVDGSVHIVPFSAVTTVTNMTRDYGFAVLDVQVGLNEEPDHIADILRKLAAELRAEPRWSVAIRDDLEVLGVDRFLASAWVMKVRLKTTPSQRWAVGRELNRRIKYKFDELAIDSPLTSDRILNRTPPTYVTIPADPTSA